MAKTKIDWADRVWNPVTGCTKISEGCRNCYAERMSKRLAGRCGYPKDNPFAVTLHPNKLMEMFKWKKSQRVFVCSMGDLFHKDIELVWSRSIIKACQKSPEHTFFFLTKRPEHMKLVLETCPVSDFPNLWLGVTVENQQAADERIPLLLQIPAAKRFISIEPMLGPVDLAPWDELFIPLGIDWVILGGETGPKARPLHPDWVRSVRDQCQAAGVPFFFKQWGEWAKVGAEGVRPGDICMNEDGLIDTADKYYVCFVNESDGVHLRRVGKKVAGHLLDGKEYRELPEE